MIGGYCPGTSCVSAATGRIDGMVYLAGMIGGLVGFAEVYPRVEHLVQTLNSGIALKRRIIEDLRPSALANLGLATALEILAREFSERAGLSVQAQVDEVRLNARVHGKPTLIVAGRNDALLPINHTARAWFAKNQSHGGNVGNTRYVEVTNAQHFDSFIGFGVLLGYDTRYIPLHVYFNRALDAMWAHLTLNVPLPPAQVPVVRPLPGPSRAPPGPPVQRPLGCWVDQTAA